MCTTLGSVLIAILWPRIRFIMIKKINCTIQVDGNFLKIRKTIRLNQRKRKNQQLHWLKIFLYLRREFRSIPLNRIDSPTKSASFRLFSWTHMNCDILWMFWGLKLVQCLKEAIDHARNLLKGPKCRKMSRFYRCICPVHLKTWQAGEHVSVQLVFLVVVWTLWKSIR